MSSQINQAFASFDAELRLADAERAQAMDIHNQITDHLQAEGFITGSRLQGSFARKTMAKELRDIDKLVFLPLSRRDELADKGGPDRAMDEIRASLSGLYPVALWPQRTTHSLPLQPPETSFSFDVVPAFRLDSGEVLIAARGWKADEPWVSSNSLDIVDAVAKRNQDCGGDFIHVVRMIKAFAANSPSVTLPGLHIESLVFNVVKSKMNFAEACQLVFSKGGTFLGSSYKDPAGGVLHDRVELVDRRSAALAFERAQVAANEAIRLDAAGNPDAAIQNWSMVFGPDFPAPAPSVGAVIAAAGSTPARTAAGLPTSSGAVPAKPVRAWRS